MSIKVADLSDEEFDEKFEQMMSTPPEEFDAAQTEQPEETLVESPDVQVEPEVPLDEEPENNIEQPQEQLDEVPVEEPAIEGEPETATEDDPVIEDSPTEPQEYDFDSIPRDKIIPRDIKVNGMTVRATMEELEDGFKKGMNYVQKMQEIAPHRKNMHLMQEHELSTDDLNLLIEAKKGNKEALSKLMANAEVDPLDLDAESSKDYVPENYAKDVPNVELEEVKSTILADKEFAQPVEDALQTMPEDMYELVSTNARGMNSLYNDMKSGLYQKVMPEVIKQQALYGTQEPTLNTYLKVAEQYFGSGEKPAQPAPAVEPTPRQEQVNKAELNNKRNSARTAPSGKPNKKESFIEEDLSKMDDEEFEKAFEKMVGRSINDFNS